VEDWGKPKEVPAARDQKNCGLHREPPRVREWDAAVRPASGLPAAEARRNKRVGQTITDWTLQKTGIHK